METVKAIEGRRSIRKYTEQKLERETIEDILNCGRLAPSGKNRQPWYFVIVKDEVKNKIAELMMEEIDKNLLLKEESMRKNSVRFTADAIKQAPVLVLIFRERNEEWVTGDNQSIGACVENMCLRATDLGIGSLWIRDVIYAEEEVAKLLGHEELELNCALALGYANQSPKMRPRKKLEDITEWF